MVVLRPQLSPGASTYRISPTTLAQLRETPWCADTLDDPSFQPLRSFSRDPPPYLVGRYSFMARTLHTPDTLPVWQGFYRPSQSDEDLGEVRALVILGSGMDGHLHTAHGGVAATLLDETMGNIGGIHKEPGKSIFTAYMRVDYKKPLPTPGTILLRAWLDPKSKGRKIFVSASLEDGRGTVYTSAEALFLEVERKHGPRI